jgi:hypothetical protein
MLGDEAEDLRDDFRGLPLESRTGVEEMRATGGRDGNGFGNVVVAERGCDGVGGDERGKGTAAVRLVVLTEILRGVSRCRGFSLSGGGILGIYLSSSGSGSSSSSSSSSGVDKLQLLDDESSSWRK